jgi:hypothetical protein
MAQRVAQITERTPWFIFERDRVVLGNVSSIAQLSLTSLSMPQCDRR